MALRRVFTYLGAVFLMSYIIFSNNANALVTTLDLSGYSIVNSSNILRINCRFATPVTDVTNVSYCSSSSITSTPRYLRGIESVEEWNFKRNDLIEFNILVYSPVNLASLDGFAMGSMPVQGGFRTIEFSELSSGVFNNDMIDITNGTGGTLYNGNSYYAVYHVVMRYLAGDNLSYKIGMPLGSTNYFVWSGETLTFSMFNINQYRLTGESSSDQQNEINATNESVQESQSEGASSQSDAQTGTASLISTIGSAVSAITTASPTNCLLNGNMGNFDMGQIDLCANPVPTFVQIIGSLILILITVPLCIVMFNRFIGLFRSFQG